MQIAARYVKSTYIHTPVARCMVTSAVINQVETAERFIPVMTVPQVEQSMTGPARRRSGSPSPLRLVPVPDSTPDRFPIRGCFTSCSTSTKLLNGTSAIVYMWQGGEPVRWMSAARAFTSCQGGRRCNGGATQVRVTRVRDSAASFGPHEPCPTAHNITLLFIPGNWKPKGYLG
jgi:hypothetical protein